MIKFTSIIYQHYPCLLLLYPIIIIWVNILSNTCRFIFQHYACSIAIISYCCYVGEGTTKYMSIYFQCLPISLRLYGGHIHNVLVPLPLYPTSLMLLSILSKINWVLIHYWYVKFFSRSRCFVLLPFISLLICR